MILGLDAVPRRVDAAERATLGDPFATQVLSRADFPMTARKLIAVLDAAGPALAVQRVFLVGDGAHLPFDQAPASVDRQLRFAITRGDANSAELMVSTGTDLDSEEIFLQVLAWDPVARVYNYYLRERPAWIWSGNSEHALDPPTRGRGPFDSHVNGSLVMKELKAPWSNWHSMSAAIDVGIAPNAPVRGEALFQQRAGAQDLERFVVKPGIDRWNRARFDRDVGADGSVRGARRFLRQVLETTSVNLISTTMQSELIADADLVALPPTFFLDSDAFLDLIGIDAPIARPTVSGAAYRNAIAHFGVALDDRKGFRRTGDSHFAFLVPERAFEDLDVLDKLLARRVLDRRVAASLLMVDFANPTHSERRAALMPYVPEQSARLAAAIEAAISAAAPNTPPGSPEREAAANLAVHDWEDRFAARIVAFMQAVQARLDAPSGFDEVLRLAESRRREFRVLPLAEFSLTVPVTNIPAGAPRLRMNEDATLAVKPTDAPPTGEPP